MNNDQIKSFNKPILITGGAGFLGSHMTAFCLEKKQNVVILDNLSNSDLFNLQKLETYFNVRIPFFNIDIRNSNDLENLFQEYQFGAVIHFAGLKSVTESIEKPILYYENNVIGSKFLIKSIKKFGIRKIIFSSSATVYGNPNYLPIDENHPVQPSNPYGENKVAIEKLFLNDNYFQKANVKLLRYFNPVGSYKGIIGERPNGVPNNLMPYILGVAKGDYEFLNIYGDDYKTHDGTGVRDYIHVMDLIEAHWNSLLDDSLGCSIYNISSGEGFSVKDVICTFESVNKIKIPFKIKPRRVGDVSSCYSVSKKINENLNWYPKFNLEEMCFDAWRGCN